MATELGVAFVSIAASTRQLGKDMRGALGKMSRDTAAASKTSGNAITKAFGNAFSVAGKAGAAAIGAVTGAFVKNTVAGVRFNSAMQGYEVAFRVLTGSAEGAARALQAVEDVKVGGTGLDKRALAAASKQLLGVGVSADDLENRLLRLAKASLDNADTFALLTNYYAAATAGAGLAANQMDALAARGFNPLQIIADKTGRTLAQVQSEFSGAEGNARALQKAVALATDEGGKFANTFDYMRGTIGGAMNVAANEIQILQSTLAMGLMPYLAGVTNAFTPIISSLRYMIAESPALDGLWSTLGGGAVQAVERLYDVVIPLARAFFNFVDRIDFSAITGGIDRIRGLLLPLGGLSIGALGPFARKIPIIGKHFAGLTGPAGLVLGVLLAVLKASPELREALGSLALQVGGALTLALEAAVPLIEWMSAAMTVAIEWIAKMLTKFLQWDYAFHVVIAAIALFAGTKGILALVAGVKKAKAGVLVFKGALLKTLVPLAMVTAKLWAKTAAVLANPKTWLAVAIVAAVTAIVAAIVWLAQNWEQVWGAITNFLRAAWDRIRSVIDTSLTWISNIWSAVWGAVSSFFSGIWNGITSFASAAVAAVRDTISRVTGEISSRWNSVWDAISSFFSRIWNGIREAVAAAIGFVRGSIEAGTAAISGAWDRAWSAVRDVVTGIWSAITSTVSSGVSGVRGMFEGLRDTLTSVFSGVASAISAPFRAAFDGIRSAWNNTVGGRGFSIPSWVPGLGGSEFRIPALAQGGITLGPTLAMIGDNRSGREAVIPLERMGEFIDSVDAKRGAGGGKTTTVNIHSPRVSARDVIRALDVADLLEAAHG